MAQYYEGAVDRINLTRFVVPNSDGLNGRKAPGRNLNITAPP